jgi:tetratricopeptide (TPR) repeat protein
MRCHAEKPQFWRKDNLKPPRMNTPPTRLQQLLAFYEADPTDAFTIYALATEYRAQEPERAWEFYQKLLTEHPDYVGTYYHAGKLLEQFDKKNQAEKVYRDGLKVARAAGQQHAASELLQALNKCLGLDYEDD